MSDFSSTKVVGCIGKCTSGLSLEELDRITDNIHTTLSHRQGIEVFEEYLENRKLTDNINCLGLYKICCKFIDEAETCRKSTKEKLLEQLIGNVTDVKEMAEGLDGVTQIDMDLMRSYNEALNSKSTTTLLAVLEETKRRCRDHLKIIHRSFKRYASQPCALRK